MKLSQFFYLAAEKQQNLPPLPDNGMCITLHDVAFTLNSSQGQALLARAKRLLDMFYPEYGDGIQQFGYCNAYWANRWSMQQRVVKRCRVLCLLFCAAIAEAQERSRRRTKNPNKQRVLRVYPNAYVCMVHRGVYVVVSDAHGFDLGRYCDRPSDAWASAARNVVRNR